MKKKTFLISIILISTFLCFAQMELPFTAYENNPVLEGGDSGAWDDDGVFLPFIKEHDGTYYLLFSGSTDLGIATSSVGFATSQDGYNFTKSSANPIFGPDGTGFDAWSVSDVVLIYENSTWILYYSGDASSSGFGPGTGIGRATAPNLTGPWERLDDPVLERGDPGEWDFHFVAPMSILKNNSEYIMYYSSSIVWYPAGPFQIGMATSPDGIVWTKYDNPETQNPPYADSDPVLKVGSAGCWDDIAAWYGSVQKTATGYEMFYSGTNSSGDDAIGYATSTHGISWTKNPDPIYSWLDDPYAVNNSYTLIEGPKVQIIDGIYFMYYDYGLQVGKIGLATAPAMTQIIHVPGDQPTIQAAIYIATHGDTILVDEGTYYENINFMGKAITVASQFLMDGDESHIENTIIDGSQPINPDLASTVLFVSGEDTTSIITGFKITGGSGILNTTYNVLSGGGIAVENSGAKMEHNIITENHIEHINGAGGCGIGAITMDGSTWLVVRNNIITHNSALAHGISAFGGGIASTMNSIIENNIIEYNECENMDGTQVDGGGVEIEQIPGSFIYAKISGNTIRYNSLTVDYVAIGAGLIVYQAAADIIDNNISHNTVTANQFGNGAGIYVYDNLGEIIIENNEITGNEIISLDWARGAGIAFSQTTEKVEINNNTIEDNYMEGFNCRGSGIWFVGTSGDLYIQENSIIHNIGPKYNINSGAGGGLCIMDAGGKLVIDKNIFIENTMYNGGGLYIRTSLNTTISNNFFRENDAVYGGGISYYNPSSDSGSDNIKLEALPLIVNNTIINNTADDQGGGIRYNCQQILPVMFNSIIRFNSSVLGKDIYSNCINEMVISYSNVIEGDITGNWTGDENIESDPMVIDDLGHISNYSECIESGTLSLEISGEIYNCPDFDIDDQVRPLNATADIGVDEVLITGIYDRNISLENSGLQILPNPSSGTIHLRYTIPARTAESVQSGGKEQGFTICDLYEISGVKIKRLLNEEKTPGTYEMKIDLGDLRNGVYFITLKTKNGSQSTKLIKL